MSFDRLAPHYRWMEWVLAGDRLQRARVRWLENIRDARRLLAIGEGNGRFLEVCARRLPHARFTCVDASQAMLEQARKRWRSSGGSPVGIEFIHGQLPDWKPAAGGFDVILTHFFLDCFPESLLERVVATLAAGGTKQARWLAADFREASSGLARLRTQAILWMMYRFFRIAARLPAHRLVCPDPFLERHGFRLESREITEWGLLHSDLWTRDG